MFFWDAIKLESEIKSLKKALKIKEEANEILKEEKNNLSSQLVTLRNEFAALENDIISMKDVEAEIEKLRQKKEKANDDIYNVCKLAIRDSSKIMDEPIFSVERDNLGKKDEKTIIVAIVEGKNGSMKTEEWEYKISRVSHNCLCDELEKRGFIVV